MKRYMQIALMIVACLSVLMGCAAQESLQGISAGELPDGFQDKYQSVEQLVTDRLVVASSASELTQVSDLIVVFTPEDQENVLLYFSDGLVSFGYTETTGKIEKVLQGDASVGDTIAITEECFTTDDGATLHTQGGYLPMKIGDSYLLFLRAYPPENEDYAGMYYPVDLEYGKYVLSADAVPAAANSPLWNAVYEVNGYTDLDNYNRWYEYVQKLYPELF